MLILVIYIYIWTLQSSDWTWKWNTSPRFGGLVKDSSVAQTAKKNFKLPEASTSRDLAFKTLERFPCLNFNITRQSCVCQIFHETSIQELFNAYIRRPRGRYSKKCNVTNRKFSDNSSPKHQQQKNQTNRNEKKVGVPPICGMWGQHFKRMLSDKGSSLETFTRTISVYRHQHSYI